MGWKFQFINKRFAHYRLICRSLLCELKSKLFNQVLSFDWWKCSILVQKCFTTTIYNILIHMYHSVIIYIRVWNHIYAENDESFGGYKDLHTENKLFKCSKPYVVNVEISTDFVKFPTNVVIKRFFFTTFVRNSTKSVEISTFPT